MRIVVYHGFYGCETGCCGHFVRLTDDDGEEHEGEFTFTHPLSTDDVRTWAEELVRDEFGAEHVADLDWENCLVVDD